jgi:hypothetical protein
VATQKAPFYSRAITQSLNKKKQHSSEKLVYYAQVLNLPINPVKFIEIALMIYEE